MIRKATIKDIAKIKKLVDSSPEMDADMLTFPKMYFKRIIQKEIMLVAEEKKKIIGICFGSYNTKEKWADLLGLVVSKKFRKKGTGKELLEQFELVAKKRKAKTIDFYTNSAYSALLNKLKYKKGRTFTSFRKKL